LPNRALFEFDRAITASSAAEPFRSGISHAGKAGGLEGTAAAFFFEVPLMQRAQGVPLSDSFSGREWDFVKEWSSGPQLCIQHFSSQFIGTESLAKLKFSKCDSTMRLPAPLLCVQANTAGLSGQSSSCSHRRARA
jgi:hypothetical protein